MRFQTLVPALAMGLFANPIAATPMPSNTTAKWPAPTPGTYTIKNFVFNSSETIPELNIHYRTIGELKVQPNGKTNAIVIHHGSTQTGDMFFEEEFAGELFGPGQVLDARKYFIVMPDAIGHGNSSKPSTTGLKMKFPNYMHDDNVRAAHALLTECLGVQHLRLVLGVSMGGMHTWLWGEMFPDYMDALLPICSQPVEIAGHNRIWRKMFMDLVMLDPAWKGGEYEVQPPQAALGAFFLTQYAFTTPVGTLRRFPTRAAADAFVEGLPAELANMSYDANDLIYQWNSSSTYNPWSELKKIKVPLTTVNVADDSINPPELLGTTYQAVEKEMAKGLGKAVVIPASNETVGHHSYILAKLWVDELQVLMCKTAADKPACL